MERVVTNPDGSAVRSEVNASDPSIPWDERHIVRLPNGREYVFENLGATQTVYDGEGNLVSQTVLTSDGPELQAVVQPVFLRRPPRPPIGPQVLGRQLAAESTEAAVILYGALSLENRPNRKAVIGFAADDFRREENAPHTATWVQVLTKEDVKKFCRRYEDTQVFLDEAVDEAHREGAYAKGAQVFGTRVHKILKDKINGQNDPNYKSEVSMENVLPGDPRLKDDKFVKLLRDNQMPVRDLHYGQRNTVRADIWDNNDETRTVCMPDAKTGKRGLGLPQIKAMVLGGLLQFPHTDRFIMFEMRPTRMQAHR